MNSKEVELALSKRHTNDFFITECKNGPTWFGEHSRMDVVAISKSWEHPCVTVYEVKVSRQDFLRDDKWPGYLNYSNRFLFACPSGLIQPEEITDPRVGLVWVNEKGNCITKKQVMARAVDIPADFFKYILYSRIDSDRTPFYSDREEYMKDYLEHKKSASVLAHQVESELVKRVAELEEQIGDLGRIGENSAKYDKLIKELRIKGVYLIDVDQIVKFYEEERTTKSINAKIIRFVEVAEEIIELDKRIKKLESTT